MIALVTLLSCSSAPTSPPPVDPADCFRELATALSGDEMEGRGLGTEGIAKAAKLIEGRLEEAGLVDADRGLRQPFTAVTGVTLGANNALDDGGALQVNQDFAPLGFSSAGTFEGDVVFVGYGIVAPEHGYDDYAGVDVKGKVVLAMRYEPGETDPASPFDGRRPSRYSDLRNKALRAREAGAAALVFVAPANGDGDLDRVPPLAKGPASSRAGLPVLQVTRAVADRWLAKAGTSVAKARAAIDAATKPASAALPGVHLRGQADVVPTESKTYNVVGWVPGEGDLADEFVVVGAHYDHLGHGGPGSMKPDVDAIHNGADDNASGTAAMICALTNYARTAPAGSRRTVVGVAFSAEEIGLGGSQYFVEHSPVPVNLISGMVNLDMVGRVQDDQLHVLGTDSALEWTEVAESAAAPTGLKLTTGGDGYGPSDHSSFYEVKVPVVHLFSGTHEQYHTPDDDAALLNVEGGGKVTAFTTSLLSSLATRPARLTYVRSVAGPPVVGDSRGYGAYLGTVPDFSAMQGGSTGGVKLGDVRAGGPAERAGVRGGDVLVGLAGAEVQTLQDMSFLLQDHQPGETVEVVVLRGGERLTFQATLGRRGEGGSPPAEDNPGTHVDRFSIGAAAAAPGDWAPTAGKAVPELLRPDEVHLADLRQLTFGGDNAEAYFSPDGRKLIFQRTPGKGLCDQEYVLDLTTGVVTRVSSGQGRTTCGYFLYPDGDRYLYSTTEAAGPACPAPPDPSAGYVWPLYDSMDIVVQRLGEPPTGILHAHGYDAEATTCMKDGKIVFTSVRDGDLDLYMANADGSAFERLTRSTGYDGGAFFSPDCSAIVWRASRPAGAALKEYQELLAQDLVKPSQLEIFRMDLATRKVTQLTSNGAANFAPYEHGGQVLFASNVGGSGPEFDIWRVPVTGGTPERITSAKSFDGFPMVSPDGKWLAFASNRGTPEGRRDTNLFIARWKP